MGAMAVAVITAVPVLDRAETSRHPAREVAVRILDAHGYRYHWITDTGLTKVHRIVGDPTYRFLNFLFVPVEREADVVGIVGRAFDAARD